VWYYYLGECSYGGVTGGYNRHNYTLPNNNTTLISNNFINRMLYADMYSLYDLE